MKKKIFCIIGIITAISLIAMLVFLFMPVKLNKTLKFNDSSFLHVAVKISEQEETNEYTFEKDSQEFSEIVALFDKYSYHRTFSYIDGIISKEGELPVASESTMVVISSSGDLLDYSAHSPHSVHRDEPPNNNYIVMVNEFGGNAVINDELFVQIGLFNDKAIVELVDKIVQICQ